MNTIAQIRANWKNSLVCAAFGSIFTIFGMIFSPLDAQRDKFGEIECIKLTLIDALTGKAIAQLSTGEHGGELYLLGSNENNGFARLVAGKNGGELSIHNNEIDGTPYVSAMLSPLQDGTGRLTVNHKNGGNTLIAASENGAFVSIHAADHNKPLAVLGTTDDGESGRTSVYRYEHGKQIGAAELYNDEYGGELAIFGKTDSNSRVVIGINEYGNGGVSTWDKNGYRQ